MTTLRIEVGRRTGTTIYDVLEGLRTAGCMKYLEIDPDAQEYVPIEDLRRVLETEGFDVELVPWPDPPPLPWWRTVRGWPRRVYYWGRRVVLRETHDQQLSRVMADIYGKGDLLHAASLRDSPVMQQLKKEAPAESFTLHGAKWRAPTEPLLPRPVRGANPCPDCGKTLFHTPDCEALLWK